MKLFYYSLLTAGPNKLEHLSLETLSSQVLEFVVLPANGRRNWKGIASYKHSCLFGLVISDEMEKKFYNIDSRYQCCETFLFFVTNGGAKQAGVFVTCIFFRLI
jgi:hypothetical protein